MTQIKVQLDNVTYNPATRAFEARAVLHDGGERHSFACAISGPITMTFEDAAGRLSRKAFQHFRQMRRAQGVHNPYTARALPASRYVPERLAA